MKIINNENYVDLAESVIKKLKDKTDKKGWKIPMVSTSQIRNILSMGAEIYNEILLYEGDDLDSELKGRIDYLRIRVMYDSGRDLKVKDFAVESQIPDILKEIKLKEDYKLFYRYMESLVAFHRFYGGKDI